MIAVQGWCLTIGIELLLAADIRVAAAGTRFAQIEVKRGIYPIGGATVRLAEEIGWGNAMRILLTGDEFSAQEAYRVGLVQELVPDGTQFERALADRQDGRQAVSRRCAGNARFGAHRSPAGRARRHSRACCRICSRPSPATMRSKG